MPHVFGQAEEGERRPRHRPSFRAKMRSASTATRFAKLGLGELKAKAFYAAKNADTAKDGKDRIIYDTEVGEAPL